MCVFTARLSVRGGRGGESMGGGGAKSKWPKTRKMTAQEINQVRMGGRWVAEWARIIPHPPLFTSHLQVQKEAASFHSDQGGRGLHFTKLKVSGPLSSFTRHPPRQPIAAQSF